jgi:hypothetical protein
MTLTREATDAKPPPRANYLDACTKAAGEVYSQAMLQSAFGAMVVPGSSRRPALGRGWRRGRGVDRDGHQLVERGRVESVGNAAFLSRFGRAHAALLAGLIGVAAIVTAEAARASHLGNVAVLVAARSHGDRGHLYCAEAALEALPGPLGQVGVPTGGRAAATELPPLRR